MNEYLYFYFCVWFYIRVYDQIELDSNNKAWKHQHDMEPAISNEELWQAKLPSEE